MKALKETLFGSCVLLLTVLALEVYARVFPRWTPEWTRNRSEVAGIIAEACRSHFFQPGLGMALKPGIHVRRDSQPEYVYTYDTVPLGDTQVGIRDEASVGQPWGVALGDSFVEGMGVEPPDLWVRQLESRTGKRILNLGQCAWTTNQYRALFGMAGKIYRPSVVLFCVQENDFNERISELEDLSILKEPAWATRAKYPGIWLLANSFTYRLLRAPDIIVREMMAENKRRMAKSRVRTEDFYFKDEALDLRLRPALLGDEGEVITYDSESPDWARSAGLVKRDIREMKSEAESIRAKLLIIYVPSKEEVYVDALKTKYKISPHMGIPVKELGKICSEASLPFLDLTPAFRAEALKKRQLYWKLDGHWNPQGNRLAGESVYEWLRQKGWI